jgi:hypothetical protein
VAVDTKFFRDFTCEKLPDRFMGNLPKKFAGVRAPNLSAITLIAARE